MDLAWIYKHATGPLEIDDAKHKIDVVDGKLGRRWRVINIDGSVPRTYLYREVTNAGEIEEG